MQLPCEQSNALLNFHFYYVKTNKHDLTRDLFLPAVSDKMKSFSRDCFHKSHEPTKCAEGQSGCRYKCDDTGLCTKCLKDAHHDTCDSWCMADKCNSGEKYLEPSQPSKASIPATAGITLLLVMGLCGLVL